mmetsp:Transcript_176584/g.566187  ORF Transcript_176584/g.566187 Transcript_176584/m.566187 type:complete len:241 (-) Transcript_176584:2-724(-)
MMLTSVEVSFAQDMLGILVSARSPSLSSDAVLLVLSLSLESKSPKQAHLECGKQRIPPRSTWPCWRSTQRASPAQSEAEMQSDWSLLPRAELSSPAELAASRACIRVGSSSAPSPTSALAPNSAQRQEEPSQQAPPSWGTRPPAASTQEEPAGQSPGTLQRSMPCARPARQPRTSSNSSRKDSSAGLTRAPTAAQAAASRRRCLCQACHALPSGGATTGRIAYACGARTGARSTKSGGQV